MNRNKFDLHSHTTVSDGTVTPTELVNKAIEEGFEYLAITDHDNIDGIKEAQKVAEGSGLTVIPGVEISVEYGGNYAHVWIFYGSG